MKARTPRASIRPFTRAAVAPPVLAAGAVESEAEAEAPALEPAVWIPVAGVIMPEPVALPLIPLLAVADVLGATYEAVVQLSVVSASGRKFAQVMIVLLA